MSLKLRRVVTGHDESGKAVITHDGVCPHVSSRRPGQAGCVVWTSEGFPADNSAAGDEGARPVGTTLPNGTVFRVVKYEPGVEPRVHRSNSIDYAMVLEGSILMQLEDGVETRLNVGDVLVQRGTIHNWINDGDVPCVIAFVLIDAKPVSRGGEVLAPTG